MAGNQARQDSLIRQLQGRLGGLKFSEPRTVGAVCASGTTTDLAVDATGIAVVSGCMVILVAPQLHWSFRWFPLDTRIVVQNDGVSESITFVYVVVGV